MTDEHAERRFPPEPWQLQEVGLHRDTLAQSESLFALSNGHIGVRGNLDEGDPNGLPGTYLNSFYESRPLPYAEPGYGYPESGQTILNVTNGKLIRLLVNDEPFDMRYGTVLHHERTLDLRRGVLRRRSDWCSPAGRRVRIESTRLVSLSRRSILAIRYRVEPLDDDLRLVVQSELVSNEPLPAQSKDPRVAAVLDSPLVAVTHEGNHHRAHLIHRTRNSKLQMAVAMDHAFRCDGDYVTEISVHPDWARVTAATQLAAGEELEVVKFVAYGWSSQRSVPALRDQVDAGIVSAVQAGWDRLEAEQAEHLEEFWDGADVEIDGPVEVQQAVRFGIFHTYQAAARAEQRAVPAKGLTGPGYDGHAFWDTEMFVLPLLSATAPEAAADALRWRLTTMDLARERAETLHLSGATFPWRTIRGQECSAYWPAGTAAMHVNAAVASAAARHLWWTRDVDFGRDVALPLLVETARLWCSLGYDGDDAQFHIDGVTGPDEYTAIVDDNTYTNMMARQNLQAAALTSRWWPEHARELGVYDAEIGRWTDCAERMAVPYDEVRRVHQQDRGFTSREVWNFQESAAKNNYPLLLHVPYFELYRRQVSKQADLVLAMHWAGESFTHEEKARNFAYYDPLTVRDSSLSACTQAVLAAEVGHLDLAADYMTEAALMDLDDLEHNSGDGLHIASLAGGWLALVAGFGGMRDLGERLIFRPQLPPGWRRLQFGVRLAGRRLRVDIRKGTVTYHVRDAGAPVPIIHRTDDTAEEIDLLPDVPVERPWEPVEPRTPTPVPPPGRAPRHAIQPHEEGTRAAG